MLGTDGNGPGNEDLYYHFYQRVAGPETDPEQTGLREDILEAYSRGGLNGKQVKGLLNQIRPRQEPDDLSQGREYKQALKILKAELAVPGETGSLRFGQALEELNQRVRRGEDLKTVLNEVKERYHPIKDVAKSLQKPRFGSMTDPREAYQQTYLAYKEGRLTEKQFHEEAVKISRNARVMERLATM